MTEETGKDAEEPRKRARDGKRRRPTVRVCGARRRLGLAAVRPAGHAPSGLGERRRLR